MVDNLITSQKGDTMADQDDTTNVQTDDIDANIADINLTDPNVDLGAPANADDTAANKGSDDAAATTDDKTATATDDKTDTDAKDTEAKADDAKTDDSQASDTDADADKSDQQQTEQTPEERRIAAQTAYQQRQRNRQQISQQLDQSFGPKTEDQLIDEGIDPAQAGLEALRQEVAYKEERARVSQLNSDMRAEAVEVYQDYPVFRELNPDGSANPHYDPVLAREAEESYKQAARLQTIEVGKTPDGKPIEIVSNADVSLYDHYQKVYNIYNRGTSKGAQNRQQQNQDMLARTENPGGSSSTNRPAPGSLEEMEERLGGVVIT